MVSISNVPSAYGGIYAIGEALTKIPESQGGWREYFDEGAGLAINDPLLRASTAIMLENTKRELAQTRRHRKFNSGLISLEETTRSGLVSGFSDYLLPVIRAGFPTNAIMDLVAVQPTNKRFATLFYLDWIVGTTKGQFKKGMVLFGANTGKQTRDINFSNSTVEREEITALGGAGATLTGTLAFHDGGGVIPATVVITATITGPTVITFADTGNGAFMAAGVTISASSINYQTGAWSITLGGLDTFTTAATNLVTYRWDSEGSQSTPQVDIRISSTTMATERRAMKINYSQEAVQDASAELGLQLEPTIVQGLSEQMNYEIAQQILSEIWAVAPVAASFAMTVPSGISQQEHFRDLIYTLNVASNNIWARTQKGYGNWIVVDELASNLIQSLPASMFVAAPPPRSVHGLHFIGTLMGTFRVYKHLHLDKEPGAAALGNILMGYKGSEFAEAGYVWAPYQMLYTTEPTQTADFITQRGFASRYAGKLANANMYARINLVS